MEPRKVGAAKHAGLGPCNVHCYGYRVTVAEDESKNACWTGRDGPLVITSDRVRIRITRRRTHVSTRKRSLSS